ncbi:hypothetical protein GLOIN_2v1768551 [Rhizophagus irregularis DAOM 181602=DAOM 197198]|nr:hypothetical protein GLOIN_2v1768551 [Rhizophagus irregularis DAOM 181602=DAOM 197198]
MRKKIFFSPSLQELFINNKLEESPYKFYGRRITILTLKVWTMTNTNAFQSAPTKSTKIQPQTIILGDDYNFNGEFVPVEVHKIYVEFVIHIKTKLHVKNAKGTKNSSLGFISNRKCLFCNINKTFYTRGEQCDQHSWTLVDRDLQVPCGGLYHCTSLTEIQPILYPSLSNKKSLFLL